MTNPTGTGAALLKLKRGSELYTFFDVPSRCLWDNIFLTVSIVAISWGYTFPIKQNRPKWIYNGQSYPRTQKYKQSSFEFQKLKTLKIMIHNGNNETISVTVYKQLI